MSACGQTLVCILEKCIQDVEIQVNNRLLVFSSLYNLDVSFFYLYL